MRGTGRHGGLDAAEGGVSAVHGALLARRALQDAASPPRMGVGGCVLSSCYRPVWREFSFRKAVGFSPVRNWPVIARVLLFHCIRA